MKSNVNVKIREVAVYHPDKVQNNDFYIDHFQKQGKDITNLLDALGRENRYIDKTETTLSMAIEASKNVLAKSDLNGNDMDMIVFVSGTPEYLWPPNAVAIHHALNGKEEAIVYDMNVACVGMVVAVEQISRNMLANPHIQRALKLALVSISPFVPFAATIISFANFWNTFPRSASINPFLR